jgi:hypothetical protein
MADIMNQSFLRSVVLYATVIFLAGCTQPLLVDGSGENVVFTVAITPGNFSQDATIRVRIWDSEQLDIAENIANCAVSYNQETQTEEVHCPEGVVYQETTLEEYEFLTQNLGTEIEIRSESVTVGEKYRLQISGLASDDCNTTSASVEEKARSENILIENLLWATTMMACP